MWFLAVVKMTSRPVSYYCLWQSGRRATTAIVASGRSIFSVLCLFSRESSMTLAYSLYKSNTCRNLSISQIQYHGVLEAHTRRLYDAIRFDPEVSSQIGHIQFFTVTTLDGEGLPANQSHRDLVNQTQREISERNTILRLYWISLNLERYSTILPVITPDSSLILVRDITDCFDELPKHRFQTCKIF